MRLELKRAATERERREQHRLEGDKEVKVICRDERAIASMTMATDVTSPAMKPPPGLS
ncbi:hypothetical protein WME81_41660 [Sorangium sp. So ce1078]